MVLLVVHDVDGEFSSLLLGTLALHYYYIVAFVVKFFSTALLIVVYDKRKIFANHLSSTIVPTAASINIEVLFESLLHTYLIAGFITESCKHER